jgi:ABC-type antimicrobial peptide transport system permease subunit
MALGAQRGEVSSLFLAYGLRLTAIGLVIGLAAAYGATRLLSSLLFGVSPVDPLTYSLVAALLALAALLACYIPARSASSMDPVQALHSE